MPRLLARTPCHTTIPIFPVALLHYQDSVTRQRNLHLSPVGLALDIYILIAGRAEVTNDSAKKTLFDPETEESLTQHTE